MLLLHDIPTQLPARSNMVFFVILKLDYYYMLSRQCLGHIYDKADSTSSAICYCCVFVDDMLRSIVGFLLLWGEGFWGCDMFFLSLFPFITICFTGILNIFFYMVNYRHQINLTSHLFEISHMIEYSTL